MAKFGKRFLLMVAQSSFATVISSLISLPVMANQDKDPQTSLDTESSIAISQHSTSFFYLGAKAGWMHYQQACEDWRLSCDANDIGWGGFIGYQLNDYFGVEAAYLDLGSAKASYSEMGVDQVYVGQMMGLELSAVGRLWLTDNWEVFAKGGTLAWRGENRGPHQIDKDTGWQPLLGVGTEYRLTERWQLRLEYQYIDKLGSEKLGGSNGHFTSLGLSYRFGENSKPVIVKPIPPVILLPPPIALPVLHQVVLFDFDSDVLRDTHGLLDIAKRLSAHPESKVQIKGYTDSVGNVAYNLKLSERRAKQVAEYMTLNGVNPSQIELEGYGEAFPSVANDTAEHRHRNRRVDVYLPAYQPKISTESSLAIEGTTKGSRD